LKKRFLEVEQKGWFDELKQREVNRELREVFRGLKQDNVPFSVIVKNTGISLQEIEAL